MALFIGDPWSESPEQRIPSESVFTYYIFEVPVSILFLKREDWLRSPSVLSNFGQIWYTEGTLLDGKSVIFLESPNV